MIMEEDVESMLREGQREDFPQSMCGACDKGKRRHIEIVIGKSRKRYINRQVVVAQTCDMSTDLLMYLLTEIIGNEEPNICRALCQAAHEIRIPAPSEGNIDTDRITLFYKLLLQITTNSIEHLEFDSIFR